MVFSTGRVEGELLGKSRQTSSVCELSPDNESEKTAGGAGNSGGGGGAGWQRVGEVSRSPCVAPTDTSRKLQHVLPAGSVSVEHKDLGGNRCPQVHCFHTEEKNTKHDLKTDSRGDSRAERAKGRTFENTFHRCAAVTGKKQVQQGKNNNKHQLI